MMFTDGREAGQLAQFARALQGAFADPAETGRRLAESAELLAKIAAADAELHAQRKTATAQAAADANTLMQLKTAVEKLRQEGAAMLAARAKEIEVRERAVATHEGLLKKEKAALAQRDADLAAAVDAHEQRAASLRAALG